jgi:hypothetical protein
MSKMGLHFPFEHLKHKLWAKERPRIKLAIWLPTIKSRESTRIPCVQATWNISLKCLDKGYNFASDFIAIGGLHAKLCAFKVVGVLIVGISRLQLGSPETKNHLDVACVESRIVYYKGEGGGFPQVQAVMSLVYPSYPWFVLAPKMFQLCTNHFVLVLCKSV